MIDLTNIIKGAVLIAFGIMTMFGIPAFNAAKDYFRDKLGDNKWSAIQSFIQVAVRAAEQVFGNGKGSEKKQWAYERIVAFLNERGYDADMDAIDSMIESEVLGLPKSES